MKSTANLLFLCMLALWLRAPFISSGMPFFYNEDEGHHFNRVVNMTKSRNFNPHYFLKPSLHFYLRMPVTEASYQWLKWQGKISSRDEIITRDPFGLAKYAFSASQPEIAEWNRAFGVFLSILTIILTYLIAFRLTSSYYVAFGAALLTLVSPALISYSATIGVDTLMTFLCMLSAFLALRLFDNFTLRGLIILSLICGLTVSSKYNAAPIAILPFAVCIATKNFRGLYLFLAALLPVIGFLCGSPYIIPEFSLFLKHVRYEAWHYAIAGHVGHTAERGLPQIIHYSKWLIEEGFGTAPFIFGVLGIALLLLKQKKPAVILFLFPSLYFIFMIAQRANFERNMLVVIPFLSIGAAALIEYAFRPLHSRLVKSFAFCLILFLIVLVPFQIALNAIDEALSLHDTRSDAMIWLRENTKTTARTAIAGELQFPPSAYKIPGVSRIKGALVDPSDLFSKGFQRIVLGGPVKLPDDAKKYVTEVFSIAGSNEKQRIVQDPAIHIYDLNRRNG